jgi:lipopolysaccharide/colanic/teichoic acid biosynthesis glycosyltransferase
MVQACDEKERIFYGPEYGTRLRPTSHAGKRVIDVVVALLVILLVAPVLLILLGLVRLDGGPVLVAQRRAGRGDANLGC